jgi:6-phosphogluconolactonase
MMLTEEFFPSRLLASRAAARQITAAIERSLVNASETAVIVSGGSTPEHCYEILANTALPWDKVNILPSDERCVPVDHEASNEGMLRRSLMTNRATHATLVSIYDQGLPPEDQCGALCEKLNSLPLPFSTSLLGMGADGHFASLFADWEGLNEGLDPDTERRCMLVSTAASPQSRITLTMSTLLQSREILLLFFGDTKREVYEQAKLPESDYPLSGLLQQQRTPVRVIWAS